MSTYVTGTGGSLPCGCRIDVVGEELHVHPCCDEHEPTLAEAAEKLCEMHGIPFEDKRRWASSSRDRLDRTDNEDGADDTC